MLSRRSALKSGAAALAVSSLPALAADTKSDPKLAALFDQFVKENLDASPLTVSALGLDKGARAYQKSQVDDQSLAGIAKNKALTASQHKRLAAFDRSKLTGDDAVSYDVVMFGLISNDDADKAFNYGPGGAGLQCGAAGKHGEPLRYRGRGAIPGPLSCNTR